tara:strand:- start:444 stop:626 length:183 start_codon:yes stop_codon:yes gene_type:complete
MTSCSKDDDDNVCLNCQGVESFDQLCEGMTDPDDGEVLTKTDLEALQLVFELFGGTCTLN